MIQEIKVRFGEAHKPAREVHANAETGVSDAGYSLLHVRVRTFPLVGDETIDPRGNDRQRD
jgi:hypothetical protein